MLPAQLKETTMHPGKRTLLKIEMDDILIDETNKAVDDLMGTKPEARFKFIQENAQFADNLDI
jgi:topoisomerase-4 subunit B